jgi:hypothetical protein
VRAIGAQRYDQRDGREKRDQANAEETRAQEQGATCRWIDKRSLWAPGGQPAQECSIMDPL